MVSKMIVEMVVEKMVDLEISHKYVLVWTIFFVVLILNWKSFIQGW
jgi:hypothetical protein